MTRKTTWTAILFLLVGAAVLFGCGGGGALVQSTGGGTSGGTTGDGTTGGGTTGGGTNGGGTTGGGTTGGGTTGGGTTGGGIGSEHLIGTWKQTQVASNGQTVSCPGDAEIGEIGFIECGAETVITFYATDFSESDEGQVYTSGTWIFASESVTLNYSDGFTEQQTFTLSDDRKTLTLTAIDEDLGTVTRVFRKQ